MGSPANQNGRILAQQAIEDEDRLSRLPDDLIHKIMSFLDAKLAVQTSLLSKRWKLIWTTLPYLNFGPYHNSPPKKVCKFIAHVLTNRNHQSHVFQLNLCVHNKGFSKGLIDQFVEYAISHNLQSLTLELLDDHMPYKCSTFSSKSLKQLTLRVILQECKLVSDYWDLPALTTLKIRYSSGFSNYKSSNCSKSWLHDSLFTCLPSLTTVCFYNWNFVKSSFSFSLPDIKTLHLSNCLLPQTVWDFPALTSIQLVGLIPKNLNHMFSALVNLQNLTLYHTCGKNYHISCPPGLLNLSIRPIENLDYMFSALVNLQDLTLLLIPGKDYYISCPPQLLNLSIRLNFCHNNYICSNIVVSAPKLCNFTSFGIFTPTIEVSELENVNIRLSGWFHKVKVTDRKQYYQPLTNMLAGLGNAKNLTFDMESIETLNEMSNLLVSSPSPFCKLKHVKLPRGFKETSISSALRSYLLGGSPKAAVVTKLPQHMMPQSVVVPTTDQNAVLHEPLAAPINELVGSQYTHQTLSIDTVNMHVQEEYGVEDTMVDADRVIHFDSLMDGTDKDQASSLSGERDSV